MNTLIVASPVDQTPSTTDGTVAANSNIGGALAAPNVTGGLSGPLVGLLGSHLGGLAKAGLKKQRVYLGATESRMKLGGKTSVTESTTAYKIETVKNEKEKLFGDPSAKGGAAIDQEFLLEKRLSEAADKRLDTRRGNVAISANYTRNDHSALIGRLAAAVARFSQYDTLSWETLTGGRDDIHNRDKVDGRIEHASNLLYVPRVSAEHGESLAWYAVVGAAMGCGNKVVTDATATDANNRVILNTPSGRELAMGCVEALSRIGNYYARSDAAVLFSWAFFKGVNNELSMVGMTDEGSYIRSVVRRNRFVVPYGVVWVSGERLASMPVPTFIDRNAAARFVDSVLIYGAASSAISDPLTMSDGNYYPSIFTAGVSHADISVVAEPSAQELNDMAIEHAKRIYDACGDFTTNYARMLDRMILGNSGDVYLDKVSGFISACFASKTVAADRHLCARTVAPYYWIEPQNVIGEEASDMPAQRHGFGYYAPRGEEAKHACWEGIEDSGHCSHVMAGFSTKFTAARKNPILLHLLNNPADGLACIIPRQTREDGLTLVGHRNNQGNFATRAQGGDSIDTFLWRHATNQLIAPAEMVQLTAGMMFMLVIANINVETLMVNRLFQGDAEDMKSLITIKSRQLQGIGIRARDKPFTRNVIRNASLAACALDTNRSLVGRMGDGFTMMPISASGAGPGINAAAVTWQNPRRLVLAGEEPSHVWQRVVGKVQTTVISHRIRHAKRAGKIMQGFEVAAGPGAEGGTPTIIPTTADIVPASVLEVMKRFGSVSGGSETAGEVHEMRLLEDDPNYDWAGATDYLEDVFDDEGKIVITEKSKFIGKLNDANAREQLLRGTAINALIALPDVLGASAIDKYLSGTATDILDDWRGIVGEEIGDVGLMFGFLAWIVMYEHGLVTDDPAPAFTRISAQRKKLDEDDESVRDEEEAAEEEDNLALDDDDDDAEN